MMRTRKTSGWKLNLFALVLAVAMVAGIGSTAAAEPLKIGFVYVSPIGDAGWTYQHDLGRLELEKNLGDKIQTKYIESVPEGAEAERVIRDLAQSGHDLIFTTSFGYMNPTIKVTKMYPKKYFEHATGYKAAKNVGHYVARFYEGRYLSGMIAGGMTKTNTLGYVAAFPIPEVIRGINAFTIGARSINPKVEVKVIWVNSWFDPGREREASEALITQGADVVTHHTDSTAPVLTAEERGVYAIGYHSDMSKYGPKAHLTATTHHWGDFYTQRAKEVLSGKWKSQPVWGGIKDGMIKLAPLNKAVPKELAAQTKAKEQAIAAGTFHPFQGPVKDQTGKVRVPAGQNMADKDLIVMDYYVEGVQGKLPK